MKEFKANEGKQLIIESKGKKYVRIPLKTHVIYSDDKVVDIVSDYTKDVYKPGDVVFMAESVVAIMQNRAIKVSDVKPRFLAKTLSKFVFKNADNSGLVSPETMEMAFREVGTPKMLFASAASVVGKLFGRRGVFYKITGPKARDIDGPSPWAMPPYNEYITLCPDKPEVVAKQIKEETGIPLAVVDINDRGGHVIGSSSKSLSNEDIVDILRDNPLGQSAEQTPMGIIREIK